MRQIQVRRRIKRDAIWRRIGRWLHGDSHDVLRRVRLLKAGVVGIGALVAVSAMILAQPSEVSAKNSFLADFTTEYPDADGTRIDECALCHVSGGFDRNAYGNAWDGNDKSFTAIEGLDSDGDGATNIVEIRALTFPGDRNDKPAATTTTTTTTTTLPTTTTSTTTTTLPTTTTSTTTTTLPTTTTSTTTTTLPTTTTSTTTTTLPTTTTSTTTTTLPTTTTSTTTTTLPTTTTSTTTTAPPPANHGPDAHDDSYRTAMDTPLEVAAPGVLTNDDDQDGDALTARIGTTRPTNGFVVFNNDGSFTYVPDSGFTGDDRFTYQAFDGAEYSDEGTVAIKVISPPRDRPRARRDSYSTGMNSPLEVADPGVLANDGAAGLTAELGTRQPAHGTLVLNEDGSFTYTPNDGFVGRDKFTYRAFDGSRYSKAATVTIRVKAAHRVPGKPAQAVKTTNKPAGAPTWTGKVARDVNTFGNEAAKAAAPATASAAPALTTNEVVAEMSPRVASARAAQRSVGELASLEVVSAAGEDLADNELAMGSPHGSSEGVSPLAVVLLTLIMSAGAFALLMLAGEGHSIGRP